MRRFLFRLALHLGMTVARLESEMSSAELSEWLAYNSVEPLPDPYWIGAQNCAVTASAWGGKGRIEDYIPKPSPRSGPIRMTAEQTAGYLGRALNRV